MWNISLGCDSTFESLKVTQSHEDIFIKAFASTFGKKLISFHNLSFPILILFSIIDATVE